MLRAVAQLFRNDLEAQTAWARREAGQQMRSLAVALVFGLLALFCAVALFVVGLIALYVWAEPRFGAAAALGIVAAALAATMLASILVAVLFRSAARHEPRPAVKATDPEALKSAIAADARSATDETLRALRDSPIGAAIHAGEQVLQNSERIARLAEGLRDKPASTVLLTLAATFLVGTIIGRRL